MANGRRQLEVIAAGAAFLEKMGSCPTGDTKRSGVLMMYVSFGFDWTRRSTSAHPEVDGEVCQCLVQRDLGMPMFVPREGSCRSDRPDFPNKYIK